MIRFVTLTDESLTLELSPALAARTVQESVAKFVVILLWLSVVPLSENRLLPFEVMDRFTVPASLAVRLISFDV